MKTVAIPIICGLTSPTASIRGFLHTNGTLGCVTVKGILFRTSDLAKGILVSKITQILDQETRRVLKSLVHDLRGEWPSGLYSLCQVTEVKLGRVKSDFGWVTSEA